MRIASKEPVGGGDINDAYRATLDDGRVVFIKEHADAPAGMFAAEAAGLEWLRAGRCACHACSRSPTIT